MTDFFDAMIQYRKENPKPLQRSVTFTDIVHNEEETGFDDAPDVEFRIPQCPGWRFGISYDKGTGLDYLFARHEATEEPFTANAAMIRGVCGAQGGGPWTLPQEAWKVIDFILTEPELAFCRDRYHWDYNFEYHSRAEAIEKFFEYKLRDKRHGTENNHT